MPDYTPGRHETTEFFQIIQNRLHFASTGQTAPELIAGRADRDCLALQYFLRITNVTDARTYFAGIAH